MNELAFHVYHLDDGPEADAVIAFLTDAGIGSKWRIERPTDETNSILIPIELESNSAHCPPFDPPNLEKAVAFLRTLRPEPLAAIRAMQLSTAMRFHTRGFLLQLPTDFVNECGR